jgi:hypothetical protein
VEIGGQQLGPEVVEQICSIVEAEPSISRRALSKRVCELMNWRAPNGNLQEMSCRKAMSQLERRGLIELPVVDAEYSFRQRSDNAAAQIPALPEIECSLKELGRIEVVPVSSRYSKTSRIWNGLMDKYHYLGSGPLCGAQIRYLICSEGGEYLGGLSFSAAIWRLSARDKWIGWSDKARRANLNRVVCNSRFLILPTIQVPNLASHVLSLGTTRLCDDWEERYGIRPVLVETFVNPKRFKGTCYLAANWINLGRTAGRSNPYPNGKIPDGKKEIFAYPLDSGSNWKERLCTEPKTALGSMSRPESFGDWTEEEFGAIEVYDERLKARLFTLASDFFAQPGVLVPQACDGSKAKTEAAYRFFDNDKVNMEILLRPHVEATVERIKEHEVVLAVQDTTTLNYTVHPATEGLGPINTKSDKGVGFIVHDTMAFSVEGTPLGLLNVQCWARDPKEEGKSEKRKKLPIEEKESFKWLKSYRAVAEVQELCPETMLVSVGDREADIYELFHEAEKGEAGPELLVRADRGRHRKVEEEFLWDKMAAEAVAGFQEVHIPRSGSRKARTAKLEIRFSEVTLSPPKDKKLPPITVWAVYAVEINYGADVKKPIEWMLLTTVEVSTFEQAVERMSWYAKRWGIEIFHRTLKSGCRIEDRRLNNADRLETCIAIDMVVAWRVFFLTMQGRETPEMPCDVILSENEWRALTAFTTKEAPPEKPPSLKKAVVMIAALGGFLGRKSDGNPGTTTVWRGLQRLEGITLGFQVAESIHKQRDGP